MKIIITEGMLRQIILNEAYDADIERIRNMQAAADKRYYSSPVGMARSKNFNKSQMSDSDFQSLMTSIQNASYGDNSSAQGNGVGDPQATQYDMNYNGTIGDWNVGKSIQWILNATSGPKQQGRCAEYVEKAIAAGGLPLMSCTENGGDRYAHSLHNCGTLRKHGFQMIASGRLNANQNYTAGLMPGDVMILDTYKPYKNHAAMWVGNQWVSDFKQNNANPYSMPADFWIYRYTGNRQMGQQANGNQGAATQSGTR